MLSIFKALKLFLSGAWDVIVWIFQLPKGIVWGLVVACFFIGRGCGGNAKKDEIARLDGIIAKNANDYKQRVSEDSTTIVRYIDLSDSLKQALQQKENIRLEYEKVNKNYVAQIKNLQGKIMLEENKVKDAIAKGFVICDTLILERKQKLLSNKYYYVIIPKPDNLRELIRD